VYWLLRVYLGLIIKRFGLEQFFGFHQLNLTAGEVGRTEGTQTLVIEGLFEWVRHPVYTLTILGWLLTTHMSVDRMLVLMGLCVDLYFAIPYEEAKLIKQFGAAYLSYKDHTPAVFPSTEKVVMEVKRMIGFSKKSKYNY